LIEIECAGITFFRKDSNKCYLFKKGYQTVSNSIGWVSYLKVEKKFNLLMLLPYKYVHENINNETDCWKECEKDNDCIGISFHNKWPECYLSKNSKILVYKRGWVSIFKAGKLENGPILITNSSVDGFAFIRSKENNPTFDLRINQSISQQVFNIRLTNPYKEKKNINYTEFECWGFCMLDPTCSAISFQNAINSASCFMFNGNFNVIIDDNWISYFKVNKFNKTDVSLMIPQRRPNVKLDHPYKYVEGSKSEQDCWFECISRDECLAINYKSEKECLLFKNDYVAVEKNNSVSIFKGKYFHRKFESDSLGATGDFPGNFPGIAFSNEYMSTKYDLLPDECWRYCQRDPRCLGNMIFNKRCYLYDSQIRFNKNKNNDTFSLLLKSIYVKK
jgi:hypothetical protein